MQDQQEVTKKIGIVSAKIAFVREGKVYEVQFLSIAGGAKEDHFFAARLSPNRIIFDVSTVQELEDLGVIPKTEKPWWETAAIYLEKMCWEYGQ